MHDSDFHQFHLIMIDRIGISHESPAKSLQNDTLPFGAVHLLHSYCLLTSSQQLKTSMNENPAASDQFIRSLESEIENLRNIINSKDQQIEVKR